MNCILISILLLLSSGGCDNKDEETSGKRPRPENVVYSEVITPPSITPIDESGYKTYYVDSKTGSDANNGLTPESPFQTLDKVSAMSKEPATKVLFKSGAVFKGSLTLKDLKGTPAKPFIVDIYGGSERARFEGGGGEQVVLIQDGNIRFRNIFITNKTGKRGMYIRAIEAGAIKNIEVTSCRFEEINWAGDADFVGVSPTSLDVRAICSDGNYNKSFGGVVIETVAKEAGPGWYEDMFITNNEFYQVSRTGIMFINRWGSRTGAGEGYNEYIDDEHNWYPNTNVVVQGNRLHYIGGDGIVLGGADNSFLDHNVCYYANFLGRTGQASVGIWPYSSRNTVVQYNESAYTQWCNGSSDGEGLDVDIACKNTIVQYNYVHHNVGGGILLCNNETENHEGTIVRNNIFLLNGGAQKGALASISTNVGRTEIYNNIVITDNKNKRVLFSDDWGKKGKSHDITFRNNIFMSTTPTIGIFDDSYIDNCVFLNNLYYNLGNFQANGMDAAALLYNPGITVPSDMDGYDKGAFCRPTEAKVFLDGLLFDGMLNTDFAGNSAIGIGYMGAFAE